MSKAEVVVDLERPRRTQAGLIVGGIHIEIDGEAFPSASWTDFVVVLLTQLALLAEDLLGGGSRRWEFMFMEGPFSMAFDVVHDNAWKITRTRRGSASSKSYADINPQGFVRSVLSSADKTLALCRSKSWWGDDEQQLETAMDRLRLRSERG